MIWIDNHERVAKFFRLGLPEDWTFTELDVKRWSSMDTQDDWMVESLSRYDAISMYDLPAPTSCLAWTSSDGKHASKMK